VIAIFNASTVCTDTDVAKMTRACKTQILQHYGPKYSRVPAFPTFFSKKADIPYGTPTIPIVDDCPDPEALAFHTEGMGGIVSGLVGAATILKAGGTKFEGALSVSGALSHEILETEPDPFVNMWSQSPSGKLYAFEICDPVQDDAYAIGDVSVSNFVLPRWFDALAPADGSVQFDYLGKLKAPFSLAKGGYAVVMAEGRTSQIGAERPAWKPTVSAARAAKRMLRGMRAAA
jgi:hypothetical protein